MGNDDIRDELKDLVERLGDLLKLDVDAVEAYNEAIERVDNEAWRSQLSSFRDDHQRHVTELTEAIRDMGHEPPSPSPDLKGKLIEGMTAMRSAMGDKQALKAMRQNEVVTNRGYEDALKDHNWPGAARDIVERGLADERRHLAWVEQQVELLD